MLKPIFLSLSDQMYLLKAVEFLFSTLVKVVLWLLYLVLNVPSVRPMYDSIFPSFSLVTVAWYIRELVLHFPGSGHWFLSRQLHPVSVGGWWLFCISPALCLFMIC